MAALDLGSSLTLAELTRREAPDGTLADFIDPLSQENRILEDITWIECNKGTYHEGTLVAFEPTGAERAYNEGITKEAGGTEKTLEPTCMLNGLSEVDAALIAHEPNPAKARLQEDTLFLKGMTKTLVSRLFDGNRGTDVRRINGINNRSLYATLQTAGSETVVFDNAGGNASATANKTSIYCIQWGEKKVDCIYPRNDPNGGGELPIKTEDYGRVIVNQSGTSETKKYPAWQMWFSCDFGLFIHDWRCVKRVVNISTTYIDDVDDFGFHENPLIDLYNQLEYGGAGAVFYCNRTIMSQIMKRANVKGNAFYTQAMEGEGPFAHPVTRFWGIPIKRVDQIANNQATVTT
jgi:hypothetical protein